MEYTQNRFSVCLQQSSQDSKILGCRHLEIAKYNHRRCYESYNKRNTRSVSVMMITFYLGIGSKCKPVPMK